MDIDLQKVKCLDRAIMVATSGKRHVKTTPDIKEIIKIAKEIEKYVKL